MSDLKDERAPALLALMSGVISAQIGAALAKGLFSEATVLGASMLRLGCAAVIFSLWTRPWRFRLRFDQVRPMIFYGASLGAMNLCFYLSLARLPLGVAVALEFLGPLTLAAARSRSPTEWLWVALAGLGGALTPDWRTSAAGLHLTPESLIGAGFALASGAFWAGYILLGRRAGEEGARPALTIGALTAFVVATPFGVMAAGPKLLRPELLGAGFGVALLSSVIPYSFDMFALKRLDARIFGLLTSLEPATGALAGLVLLGEHLTLLQLAGLALIVSASAGCLSRTRKDPTEPL